MSNLASRLAKLESNAPTEAQKYICVVYPDQETKGYTVMNFGGGNSQHFATRADFESFEARPDVDLTILNVVYASEARP